MGFLSKKSLLSLFSFFFWFFSAIVLKMSFQKKKIKEVQECVHPQISFLLFFFFPATRMANEKMEKLIFFKKEL